MNEITISGQLTRRAEIKEIESAGQRLQVANGNLRFFEKRGEQEKESWVDVEAWQDTAYELADVPADTDIVLKGSLVRRSWPDKMNEGKWVKVIRVKVREIVQSQGASDSADPGPQAPPEKDEWGELPF